MGNVDSLLLSLTRFSIWAVLSATLPYLMRLSLDIFLRRGSGISGGTIGRTTLTSLPLPSARCLFVSTKLPQLNETYDPHDKKNIVRLLDYFQFQNHLCLVFELLSINLYELLKQNQFRGLPLTLIRHFIKQILDVSCFAVTVSFTCV